MDLMVLNITGKRYCQRNVLKKAVRVGSVFVWGAFYAKGKLII